MNDITPETIICPVCKWQWDNKNQNCPNCNFPIAQFKDLLAGKRILSDDDLIKEFHNELEKAKKVYEERKTKLTQPNKIICPVDGSQWDEISETCPQCDFPFKRFENLLKGKPVISDPEYIEEFERTIGECRIKYEQRHPEEINKIINSLRQNQQTSNPIAFLSELKNYITKFQTENITLLENLLSSLEEDFLVPVADRIIITDDKTVTDFASLYTEIKNLVKSSSPTSPLAKRFKREDKTLNHTYQEIAQRIQAEKLNEKRLVKERYDDILRERRENVRNQSDVRSLISIAIILAIIGVILILIYDPYILDKLDKNNLSEIQSSLIALGAIIGAIFGARLGEGRGGVLVGALLGSTAVTILIILGLFIGIGALFASGVCFLQYLKEIKSVKLTAEELANYQRSLRNIEEYYQQKEKLEQAKAIVKIAREKL
jgi:hypothetical protein